MKVVITGAAGCLGRQLVKQLSQDSEVEIFATDIRTNPFKAIKQANLNYQTLDICTAEFTDWLCTVKPNKVIHLASILQISKQLTRAKAYQIDVLATKKLLQTCIRLNVEKFIVTTSGAAYGYHPENKDIITEQRKIRGNQDYFYSAHKAEVEQLMADFRQQHPQLQQIVFRPGAIIGPNFNGPVVNLFQQKIIVGLLGYPSPFNFAWSTDVVAYLIEGLHTNITGQFNIAGDGALTMKEIAACLNKLYLPLPAWLIQAVLSIAKPLGLSQYGPEQVKFMKYRPVLANDKLKTNFQHKAKYTSLQALTAYLKQISLTTAEDK